MITRALVYSIATFRFLAWAGDVFSSLVVSCLGCKLFGEPFPLVVPLAFVSSWAMRFLHQHPTN